MPPDLSMWGAYIDQCLNPFYSNTPLLIIYLSVIELFIIEKMSLLGFTSFDFAQNTVYDFQNTVLSS